MNSGEDGAEDAARRVYFQAANKMLCVLTPPGIPVSDRPKTCDPKLLNVSDIYRTVEKQRTTTSRQSLSRTRSAWDHKSMLRRNSYPSVAFNNRTPSRSTNRLPSRAERYPTSPDLRRTPEENDFYRSRTFMLEHAKKFSKSNSDRHYFIQTKPCIRSRSAVDREIEGIVRSLPRQCCDVLGPRSCHDCALELRREKSNRKYDSSFPNLHTSSSNFTTAVLVGRALPGMGNDQIQTKVARGEIMRPRFKETAIRLKRDQMIESSSAISDVSKSDADVRRKDDFFFTNIQDLNDKIVKGKGMKKLRFGDEAEVERKEGVSPGQSLTDMLCPTFVSPKKLKPEKTPSYVAYYDPPLLPKVCQNAEPAFFAGTESAYKLPDRLPEKVV